MFVQIRPGGDVLWATGQNTNDWMGDASTGTAFHEIALPAGCRIAQLFKNPVFSRSFLLCIDGRLFAAGQNFAGQLCLGTTTDARFTEVTLPDGKAVKAVATGGYATILHMTDGSLYGCGASDYREVLFAPVPHSPPACHFVSSWLDRATALLLDNGDLYGAGWNAYGQLGLGTSISVASAFTQIPLPTGRTATAIGCASWNLAAILDDGSLATCGHGSYGVLGDGTTTNRFALTTVALPGTGRKAASIHISGATLFVRSADGRSHLWDWKEWQRVCSGVIVVFRPGLWLQPILGSSPAVLALRFFLQLGLGHTTSSIALLTDIPITGGAAVAWLAPRNLGTFAYTTEGHLLVAGCPSSPLSVLPIRTQQQSGSEQLFMTTPGDRLVLTESDLLTPQRGMLQGVAPDYGGALAWGLAAPSLTSISPATAEVGSTATLTLTGAHFRPEEAPVTVTVGGLPCANLVVVNASCLQCTTDPALPLGSHDVVVTNTDIGLSATLANAFTVLCFHVSSLSATVGRPGDVITVTGCDFTTTCRSLWRPSQVAMFDVLCSASVSRVQLGATGALLATTFLSATSIQFVVPVQPSAATVTYEVFVTETATGMQSFPNGATFSYPPTVSGLSVLHGPAGSMTTVTVTGTNFAGGATVRLGTGAAHIEVTPSGGTPSSTSLTFAVPTQASAVSQLAAGGSSSIHSGQWAVAVVNPASAGSGLSAETGPGLTFSYEPVVTGVSPVWIARTAASTSVTVTGRNLYSGATVHLAVAAGGGGGSGTAPPGGDITPISIAPSEDALTFDLPAPASGVADLLEVHVSMPAALMGGTGGSAVYSPQTAVTIHFYIPPAVASVSAATSNAHSTLAKVGDQVTVTFTVNVALDTSPSALPVVTLAGRGAAVAFAGTTTTFTAVLAMASGDTQGDLTFALSGMRDPQGNPQAEATITGTLAVVFDSVAPQLTAVTGASSSGVAGFARVGDQVTLTLQADEALEDDAALPEIMLAGRAAAVQLVGPATVRATVVLLVGDPLGPIGYTISGSLCDLAGNCDGSPAPASGLTGITFDLRGNRTLKRLQTMIQIMTHPPQRISVAQSGDVITVTGCGFTATCRARLGATGALLATTFLSATSIQFVVPVQPSAATVTYEVFVTETATGVQSPPSTGAAFFSYAPTVSGLSVLHGPAGGTTTVTVTGTNFAGGAAVRLGTGAAHIDVTPSSGTPTSTSLTFAMPTQASAESQLAAGGGASSTHSGQWAVAVVNPTSAGSGLSAETGPGLTFSYEPVVTGVSPVWMARTAASTSVTVTGRNLYSGAAVHLAVAAGGGGGSGTAPPGGDITPISIAPSEDALTFDLPAPASGVADLLEVHVSMPAALMGGTGGGAVYSPQSDVLVQFYTPPAVVSVSAATSNAHSPLLAKVGDQVTVSFTANVALDDTSPSALPVVTLAGRGAAVTFTTGAGATTFTAVLAMASGDAQGNLTFALSGMRDPHGNPQEATITGTLDVVFDSVAPRLTAVTGASSSGAVLARVGDQVTLTLQADEALDDAAATLPGVMLAGRAAAVQLVGPATVRATVTLMAGDPLGPIGYTLSGSLSDLAGNCNSSLVPTGGLTGITFGKPDGASYISPPRLPFAAEASAARSNLTFARQATTGTWQTVLIRASDPDGNPVPCTATCAGTAFALELSSAQAGLGAAGVPLAAVGWSCLGTDFLANYSAPLVAAPDYILWCVDLLGPRERAPWGLVVTPDSISVAHCNMTIPATPTGDDLTVGVPCTSTFTARDRWGNHIPCTNATANATFVLLLDETAPANLSWTCTGGGDFAGTFTPMAPFGHTLKGATRASGEPVGEEATITVEPEWESILWACIFSCRFFSTGMCMLHLAPVDGSESVFSTNSTIIVAGQLLAVNIVARDAYGRSDVVCTAANYNTTFALLWGGFPEGLSWDCSSTAAEGLGRSVWVATFRPVVAGPHQLAVMALSDGAFLTGGGTHPPYLTVTVVQGPIAASQTTLEIMGGSTTMAVETPIILNLTARDAWRNPIGCTNDTASRLMATVDGSDSGPVAEIRWSCSGGGTFIGSAWTPTRGDAGRRTVAVLLGGQSAAEAKVIASANVTITGSPTAADSTFTLSPSNPAAGSQLRVIIRARDPAGTEFGCTPETANTTFAMLIDGGMAPGDATEEEDIMWACSEGAMPASFVAVLTVPNSAGPHTISVTLDGHAIGGTVTDQIMAVTEAVVSAAECSFVAPTSTPAGAGYTVTVTARDGVGNVVPCSDPTSASTFRLLWDGVSLASGLAWSCTGSPAAANFTATFAPTAAGRHTVALTYGGQVLAMIGGGAIGTNVTVIPGPAAATHSTVRVSNTTAPAGSLVQVTFTARDEAGNVVGCTEDTANATFAVGWWGGAETTPAPAADVVWSCSADRPALFVATWCAYSSTTGGGGGAGDGGGVGTGELSVAMAGSGEPLTTGPNVTMTLTPAVVSVAGSSFVAPESTPAGAGYTVTATARDTTGNVVPCTGPTAASTFRLLWDGAALASSGLAWSCTGSPAAATFTATFAPTAAGPHTVALTYGGRTVGGSGVEANVTVTPGPTTASHSTMRVSNTTAPAGSLLKATFTARDEAGNVVGCTEATANATFAVAWRDSGDEQLTSAADFVWTCSADRPALFVATWCTRSTTGGGGGGGGGSETGELSVAMAGSGKPLAAAPNVTVTLTPAVISAPLSSFVASASTPAGAGYTVTATARDAVGNVVPCTGPTAASTFRLLWDGAALASSGLTWACTGSPAAANFTATFAPTTAGPHTVALTYGGRVLDAGCAAINLTLTPGPATATHSTVRVSNTTAPAGSLVQATFTARDEAGNVVGCTEDTANVTFDVAWWGGGNETPAPVADLVWSCSGKRPALFVATWCAYSTTDDGGAGGGGGAGELSVAMAGSGEPLATGPNVTMTLTPPVVSTAGSSFVAPASTPAGAGYTVTVTARDAVGNVVPCTSLTAASTFRLLWDGAALASLGWACTGSSLAAANFTATFAPTAAGPHTVVLTYGGRALSAVPSGFEANVTVTPGAVSGERSRVAVVPLDLDVVIAGQPVRATFTARDPFDNLVGCVAATAASTFAVGWGDASSGAAGAAAPAGLAWSCDGSAFAATFSPTASGLHLLEATLAPVGGAPVGGSSASSGGGHPVRVVPASPSALQSSFTTTAPMFTAGAALSVTVTGRDPYGNAVPCTAERAATTFGLLWDDAPTNVPATNWSCLAAAGTPSCFVGTFTPTAAGTHTLTVTVGGTPLGGIDEAVVVNVTIRPGAVSAATSVVAALSPSDGQLVPGRAVWVALAAHDHYGNPVPCTDATVNATFALTLDGSPWGGDSGAGGRVGWACSAVQQPASLFVGTFSCTAADVGSHIVEVVLLAGGSALADQGGQFNITVTGPATASHSTVRVSNTTAPAGSLVQVTFTARDEAGTVVGCTEDTANATFAVAWWGGGDELGRPATADVMWSCSADRPALFVATWCTYANGSAYGGAGTGELSVAMADSEEPLATGPNVTMTLTPAVVSAARSSFVAPASTPAGAGYTVTVTAHDTTGNVVPCANLTVASTFRLLWDGAALASSGLTWACTGSPTAATFTATFAPTATGCHTVALTYGGQVLGAISAGAAAANVTVIPGPPSAAPSSFTISSSTVMAGAAVHATFTAHDCYGNAVPCDTGAAVPFAVFLDGHTPTGLAWLCTGDSPARFLATWLAPLQPGSHNITASCGGVSLTDGPFTLAVLADTTPPTIASASVLFASDNPNGPTRARLGDHRGEWWGASWVVLQSDCDAQMLTAAVVNATDRAGNPLPSGTTPVAAPATVELDCTRPCLSRLTFTSSNALPRVAQPGDLVTVRFTATEPLRVAASSPIGLTIAGHPVNVTAAAPVSALNAANDTDGWMSFEASYQLTGADSLGPVGFTVLTLADLAGNTLEAPLSTPTEGPAVIYFGSSCALDADCGTNGACYAVAAGIFGCRCPPGSSGARCETAEGTCTVKNDCHHGGSCEGAAPSKTCTCKSAWAGDHCDTPVAETYRCHTGGECQAGGDRGARCAAGELTTTAGGSFERLWECQCSQAGYALTATPSGKSTCRPAASAASAGLLAAYVAGPLGGLLLIAGLLAMLLLARRRNRLKRIGPQEAKKQQELSIVGEAPSVVGLAVVNPLGPAISIPAPPTDPPPSGSSCYLPEDLGGPPPPAYLLTTVASPPKRLAPTESPVIVSAPAARRGLVDAWGTDLSADFSSPAAGPIDMSPSPVGSLSIAAIVCPELVDPQRRGVDAGDAKNLCTVASEFPATVTGGYSSDKKKICTEASAPLELPASLTLVTAADALCADSPRAGDPMRADPLRMLLDPYPPAPVSTALGLPSLASPRIPVLLLCEGEHTGDTKEIAEATWPASLSMLPQGPAPEGDLPVASLLGLLPPTPEPTQQHPPAGPPPRRPRPARPGKQSALLQVPMKAMTRTGSNFLH
ncbi:putative protocadherin Fat 4 [Paratrimastix pyriformis]|uniref:Protocadherin Fat 4 n=1 Tax=Paratrimastix pyriformis TaxID=342808 RepID=A0ABQ8UT83_9EUKA|nr:putative protocadherin Fat 4 [Paratrimastix pyriformis]